MRKKTIKDLIPFIPFVLLAIGASIFVSYSSIQAKKSGLVCTQTGGFLGIGAKYERIAKEA